MALDFDVFFRERYPPMVATLTLVVGSREAAEDAAQHGFLQALRRWRRVRMMANPGGWVYVVALRAARKNPVTGLTPDTDRAPTIDDMADEVIDRELLRDAVLRLPPRQRAVFVLRHAVGLTAAEIATGLGVTPSTVRVLDHQARQRLCRVLSSVDEHEEGN